MIPGLFIGSNDGRPPQAYKQNLVSLRYFVHKLPVYGYNEKKTDKDDNSYMDLDNFTKSLSACYT